MSESGSFLEQRIKLMLTKRNKWAGLSALVLVGASLGMAVFAAQVTPPRVAAPNAAGTVTLAPAVLDHYVGFYKISPISRVAVTRSGNGLVFDISGQAAAPKPVYAVPLGADRFAVQGEPAVAHFSMEGASQVTGMDVAMGGIKVLAAQRIDKVQSARIDAALAARIKAQKPFDGSTKALQRLLANPDSTAGMSAALARIQAQQKASRDQYLAELGPVQSYRFSGVDHFGADVYTVKHAYGTETVTLLLDPDGTLEMAFRHI